MTSVAVTNCQSFFFTWQILNISQIPEEIPPILKPNPQKSINKIWDSLKIPKKKPKVRKSGWFINVYKVYPVRTSSQFSTISPGSWSIDIFFFARGVQWNLQDPALKSGNFTEKYHGKYHAKMCFFREVKDFFWTGNFDLEMLNYRKIWTIGNFEL